MRFLSWVISLIHVRFLSCVVSFIHVRFLSCVISLIVLSTLPSPSSAVLLLYLLMSQLVVDCFAFLGKLARKAISYNILFQRYLKQYEYGNAETKDLWNALRQVRDNPLS